MDHVLRMGRKKKCMKNLVKLMENRSPGRLGHR